MTVYDVLIQTMVALTGEPETAIAGFIDELKKREPNKILDQEISPEEADTLRAALREGAEGPIAKLVKDSVEAFRLTRRGNS